MATIMTAREAANLINNGDTIAICSCENMVLPETVLKAIEERYLETGEPNNLTELHPVVPGMGIGLGLEHFAHEGMVKTSIASGFSYLKTSKFTKLINENKVMAYDVPMGTMYQMLNDIGHGAKYTLTKVGLNTFVDPRLEGGCMNEVTPNDYVKVIDFEGEEYLCYKNPSINYSIIRGTSADEYGNISLEEEPMNTGVLSLALAAKASGGKVIAQVKRMVTGGSLHPRSVIVPGIMVDVLVVDPDQMVSGDEYNAALTGEIRMPVSKLEPMPLDYEKVIVRRAAKEITKAPCAINLGVGMPTGIPRILVEEDRSQGVTFVPEHGSMGGVPGGRAIFGTNINPEAITDAWNVFSFFRGGSLDGTFLGCGQMDPEGNVNVSKFNNIVPGCGGFIDITHSTKKIVFCGSFTSGGLQTEIKDGKLKIIKEGKYNKIVPQVEQITLSCKNARERGQKVLYVMERCVFELGEKGIVLIEIAPGIDLEKDIFDVLGFKVDVSPNLKLMDEALFR
ncbi:MAG: acyl CoA:acetate/3-ketoacid CoA transferase [Acetivibrionales bacterium]